MMTSNMLHERFHRSTGIAFSSIYPGTLDGEGVTEQNRSVEKMNSFYKWNLLVSKCSNI